MYQQQISLAVATYANDHDDVMIPVDDSRYYTWGRRLISGGYFGSKSGVYTGDRSKVDTKSTMQVLRCPSWEKDGGFRPSLSATEGFIYGMAACIVLRDGSYSDAFGKDYRKRSEVKSPSNQPQLADSLAMVNASSALFSYHQQHRFLLKRNAKTSDTHGKHRMHLRHNKKAHTITFDGSFRALSSGDLDSENVLVESADKSKNSYYTDNLVRTNF